MKTEISGMCCWIAVHSFARLEPISVQARRQPDPPEVRPNGQIQYQISSEPNQIAKRILSGRHMTVYAKECNMNYTATYNKLLILGQTFSDKDWIRTRRVRLSFETWSKDVT